MTVAELLEELKGVDPDTEIFMMTDPEGNDYFRVVAAEVSPYCSNENISDSKMPIDPEEHLNEDVSMGLYLWP